MFDGFAAAAPGSSARVHPHMDAAHNPIAATRRRDVIVRDDILPPAPPLSPVSHTLVFTPKTLAFLRSLKRNNDRAWFHAHRDAYEADVRTPMLTCLERLAHDLPTFAPEVACDPKISMFRPWRDTRFSEDKSPLKTHVAATFPHRALGRLNGAGLYFEIAPRWVWIGGGVYAPDTSQLQALREHIATNHRTLDRIVKSAGFTRLGGLQGDRMTRVPRGYASDHPAAHYLQFKQFLGFREEAADFAIRPDFYKQLVTTLKVLAPLVRFLNEPILEMRRTESRAHILDGSDGPVFDRRRSSTLPAPNGKVTTV
jgi:uncharacterized protein (TIGR02453 family)